MFDYSRLRGRIVEKYGSMRKLAIHLDISCACLNNKFKNKKGFSMVDIIKMSKLLDIPPQEYAYFFAHLV